MDDLLTFAAVLKSKGRATKHVYPHVYVKYPSTLPHDITLCYQVFPLHHDTTVWPLLRSVPGFLTPDAFFLSRNFATRGAHLWLCAVPARPFVRPSVDVAPFAGLVSVADVSRDVHVGIEKTFLYHPSIYKPEGCITLSLVHPRFGWILRNGHVPVP